METLEQKSRGAELAKYVSSRNGLANHLEDFLCGLRGGYDLCTAVDNVKKLSKAMQSDRGIHAVESGNPEFINEMCEEEAGLVYGLLQAVEKDYNRTGDFEPVSSALGRLINHYNPLFSEITFIELPESEPIYAGK
ncbi:hypothetical protein KY317_01715 [Candidatus Woesearchaeota archaeon]|nr:hypothetical protein [Candidatus Woesearchaeota archaeon]